MTDLAEFIPFDPEGGLVFSTTLPGGPDGFPERRGPGFDEEAWAGLDRPHPDAPLWIHLDRTKARAQRWLRDNAGLAASSDSALLAEETRPRGDATDEGLLVILRGVNLNPGAEPDELIVLRMFVQPERIITLRQFRFETIRTLRQRAERGEAPATTGGMLVAIADGLTRRIWPVVENLRDLLDEQEEKLTETDAARLDAGPIAEIRRQAIRLRRFLEPQRAALFGLLDSEAGPLDEAQRAELTETAQQTTRLVEDLEEIRDRAAVTQEEIRAAHERQANRTMYLLTLVAAIALPLGLITGLLGINVGGMPGSDHPAAFWIVTGGMVVVAAALVGVFRWMRWL
jgi:zinc transporter